MASRPRQRDRFHFTVENVRCRETGGSAIVRDVRRAKIPAALGYRMPAEWEPHSARGFRGRAERISFSGRVRSVSCRGRRMLEALLASEPVCINVCNGAHEAEARRSSRIATGKLTFYRIRQRTLVSRSRPDFLTRDEEPRLRSSLGLQRLGGQVSAVDLDEVVPTRVAEILNVPVFYPRMISRAARST